MRATVETVTPEVMAPLEDLSAEALIVRVAQVGRSCVTSLAVNSRYLSSFCDRLQSDDLWKKVAPTWDGFCRKAFGHPGYYVDMIRAGVALLDKGDDSPIPLEDATKAAIAKLANETPALSNNGTNQHYDSSSIPEGDSIESSFTTMIEKVSSFRKDQAAGGFRLPKPSYTGLTSEYLVARIKRDRPDIADRMVKGEFSSVNEAARQAGITVRPTVKLGDPKTVASSIARLQGQEYVIALIEALEQVRQQAKGQET